MVQGVDPDAPGPDPELDVGEGAGGQCPQGFEAHGVAGPQDVTEHGGVVRPAGHGPGLHGGGHEVDGLRGHLHASPAGCVQPADLAVETEPAPEVLEVVEALPGLFRQTRATADGDDGRVAAHDPELEPVSGWHGTG